MNKKFLLLLTASLFATVIGAFEALYPTGAPAGYTGSPGDGNNCTSCHGGTATTSVGLITSNIPASGYVPGTTYQITATNTLSGSGKYGFEVSPQNASGAQLGTLAAGTGSKLVGNGKYVTHSNATIANNAWTFNWTAPVAGTGDVTFYGAFARGNPGPVTLSSLIVSEAASAPGAAGPISGPASVCVSSVKNYSVGTIAGATSYVWSVPSGATITAGQGTTAITVSFGASASSGNVSVYGSNTAGNGTPSTLAVTVNDLPATAATPAGPAQVDLLAVSVSDYTTTGASGATSYTWEILPAEAGTISGSGLTGTVTWGNYAGTAQIRVKPMNSCGEGAWSASFSTVVFNSVGIENPAVSSSLNVYPSPTDGQVTIDLTSFSGEVTLLVSDLSGHQVDARSLQGGDLTRLQFVLPDGMYIVSAENGAKKAKKKIIIER